MIGFGFLRKTCFWNGGIDGFLAIDVPHLRLSWVGFTFWCCPWLFMVFVIGWYSASGVFSIHEIMMLEAIEWSIPFTLKRKEGNAQSKWIEKVKIGDRRFKQ